MRDLIEKASKGYPDEAVLRFFNDPDAISGDTLAEFISKEIEETYSLDESTEEQIHEAIRVMESARRELDGVIRALGATS